MKKIYLFVSILLVTFFSFTLDVKANSIYSIDMDIYIDDDGNAHVTETWDTYLNEGTEGYKPYYNLGQSTITDFTVTEGSNTYTPVDYWNINGSFSDKSYKNGIVEKSDGVELCWGISKYGSNKYKLQYTINNFIYKTSDNYQLLYWTLVPYELSSKPGKVTIRIRSDQYFKDSLDVWGYGNYGGTAYVYDGVIEMNSDGELDSNEYMTILVKFPEDTFNVTTDNLDMSFDEYKKMADEDSKKYKMSFFETIMMIFSIIASMIFPILMMIFVIITTKNQLKYPYCGTKRLHFGTAGKTLTKKYDYYRELPCNKDIFRAYWVANSYGLIKKKEDFLGSVLLKWTKENVIKIEKKEAGVIFKKEDTTIVFVDKEKLTTEIEKSLYDMMYQASKDGTLEANEFEKWCNINYKKILGWFDKVIDDQTMKLVEEGKCTKATATSIKIIRTNYYEVDPSMKEEAEKMAALKRFLEDFSNMSKVYPIEVLMWEEYLMFAQIFGIADKVAKEFKKIYPDAITDLSVNEVTFINSISHSGMTKATTARARAQSYSSGGGGFSSGGGGGGSFGGGGGGGGFR
mgnify:CR=1 FL=1